MSLFNFSNRQNKTSECNCKNCSHEKTVETVINFTDIVLQVENEEELFSILFDMFETAKIQGIKEYLYDSITEQSAFLETLNNTNIEFYNDDNEGGNPDNWIDMF